MPAPPAECQHLLHQVWALPLTYNLQAPTSISAWATGRQPNELGLRSYLRPALGDPPPLCLWHWLGLCAALHGAKPQHQASESPEEDVVPVGKNHYLLKMTP